MKPGVHRDFETFLNQFYLSVKTDYGHRNIALVPALPGGINIGANTATGL